MSQAYHGRSAHAGIKTGGAANPAPVVPAEVPADGNPEVAAPADSHSHDHAHDHGHAHGHSDHTHTHPFHNPHEVLLPSVINAPTTAEANRAHYDANAGAYDKMEMANELASKSAEAMRRVWEFKEEETVVMDYACGTGLVSRALAPYCKTIIGVDISQGMVDYYNERVSNQGIPPSEMRAIRADLPSEPGELAGMQFDVVVCSQAYHHFADIEGTTKTLASYLKPGGALLVVDLMKTEHALHMHTRKDAPEHVKHTVAHKGGLEEGQVRACFEAAGLGEFEIQTAYEREVEGRKLGLFVAKGVKATE